MSVWILITQCVAFVILVNNFFSLIFRISEQQRPDINNKGIKNQTKIFKTKIDSETTNMMHKNTYQGQNVCAPFDAIYLLLY